MSQIGYMFLAPRRRRLGRGDLPLMTHAFFKALLFLASGAVIIACHHEQNIFRWAVVEKLPLAYASFVVGGCGAGRPALPHRGLLPSDEILWGPSPAAIASC